MLTCDRCGREPLPAWRMSSRLELRVPRRVVSLLESVHSLDLCPQCARAVLAFCKREVYPIDFCAECERLAMEGLAADGRPVPPPPPRNEWK